MAITRVWQSGAETGSANEFDDTPNASVGTGNPYTGTYALQAATNANARAEITISATLQLRAGCFFNPYYYSRGDVVHVISFRDSGDNSLVSIRQDQNNLYLYVGGVLKDTAVNENGGGDHFHIALDAKINASSGWAYVYKDGAELMSFSGNTDSTNIEQAGFGGWSATAASGAVTQYFDDMYIDDTTGEGAAAALPIKRFYFITPDGNGNYADWVGSDADSTDNYLLVDDVPPDDDTTYVETTSVDQFDSYTMTTHTLDSGQSFIALIPIAYAKREGSTEQIALGTRLSSTDSIGSDQNLPTSYGFVWERQITKPGGGSWGQSDVNGVETVIKSRGSF